MAYELRIPGDYDVEKASDLSALHCNDESMTHQEFAEESDINTIIERFGIGENPIEAQRWVTNVDIADAPDNYQDVMNQLNLARDQFMSLPAKVRSEFDNDPHKFVEFVSDAANVDRMESMGLLSPEAVERRAQERQASLDAAADARAAARAAKAAGTGSS